MGLSIGGVASGIDTQSIINTLMSVAQQPVTDLTNKKSLVDSASQTISTFSSKLSALKNAALALSTTVGFASYSATSSDASIVASVSGSSSVGTYAVEVSQLAKAQKSRSTAFATSSDSLGMTGPLTITDGRGKSFDVDIQANDSLSSIASKISSSGARVSASVLSDGTGYRLLVQGLDTGASNAFTVSQSGNVALGFDAPTSVYDAAQDAKFTVDKMELTSKTNQVTGVIPGVKLALTKVTTGPVTVGVSGDSSSVKQKITAFVNAYNDVINSGHAAAGFGTAKANNSVLAGDNSIRTALHKLGGIVGGLVPGATGSYRTLGAAGVALTKDGTLSFDATKFDAALAADPTTVSRLFVTDAGTGATGLMKTIMDSVTSLVTGSKSPIQARIDSLSAQSKRLDDSKTALQDRLDKYQEQLKKQFAAMDAAVGKYQQMQSALTASLSSGSSK
ncbi:Flagellar hook-associated protein FliD [Labilithrix luteola]|uniref:Flagellar hook-associated protein 2 n=1 Tax=Labilithrix luteola TaxID=1391654 RepID=A0A0K1PMI0_9BACT|nr:flagellar filament capping protein FliD [Labilithrix luteola]AKU94728.1 Flagellar hook-associated protein FliD [Labilithrix luteola]